MPARIQRTPRLSSCFGPVDPPLAIPAAVVGVIEDTVTTKASVPYTGGQPGYNATFTAVVKNGSLKGDSFVEPTGIIVGDY